MICMVVVGGGEWHIIVMGSCHHDLNSWPSFAVLEWTFSEIWVFAPCSGVLRKFLLKGDPVVELSWSLTRVWAHLYPAFESKVLTTLDQWHAPLRCIVGISPSPPPPPPVYGLIQDFKRSTRGVHPSMNDVNLFVNIHVSAQRYQLTC